MSISILDANSSSSFSCIEHFYSDTTKKVLIGASFIHLKCDKKLPKFSCDLSTVSPRILLSGPAGSLLFFICF